MSSIPNQFQVRLTLPQRLLVELSGRIDATDNLMNAIVETLAEHPQVRQVLIDVRNVDNCSDMARVGLGTLQKTLVRRQLRTAWVVGSGRMHGLVRLISIRVSDHSIATFITMPQAEQWLGGTVGRVEELVSKVVKPT